MITSELIEITQGIARIICFALFTYSYVKKDIYGLVYWGIFLITIFIDLTQ